MIRWQRAQAPPQSITVARQSRYLHTEAVTLSPPPSSGEVRTHLGRTPTWRGRACRRGQPGRAWVAPPRLGSLPASAGQRKWVRCAYTTTAGRGLQLSFPLGNFRSARRLVSVPTGNVDKPGNPRLFIMTPTEIDGAMDRYLQDRRARGTSDDKWQPAIRWRDAEDHENRWNKLPE